MIIKQKACFYVNQTLKREFVKSGTRDANLVQHWAKNY